MVSVTSSANFGHTIGKPIVYGYLPVELAEARDFTIEAFGEQAPACAATARSTIRRMRG